MMEFHKTDDSQLLIAIPETEAATELEMAELIKTVVVYEDFNPTRYFPVGYETSDGDVLTHWLIKLAPKRLDWWETTGDALLQLADPATLDAQETDEGR